jgi:hypothetical protein
MDLTNQSDRVVHIHEWGISQLADVGDAAEEMLLIDVARGVTAGAGGQTTGATETTMDGGDSTPTAAFTYSAASSTGGSRLQAMYWNIRVPLQVIYTPETRPVLGPSEVFAIDLTTAPADEITVAGYIIWEEVGT